MDICHLDFLEAFQQERCPIGAAFDVTWLLPQQQSAAKSVAGRSGVLATLARPSNEDILP